jgi:hypothetical protein
VMSNEGGGERSRLRRGRRSEGGRRVKGMGKDERGGDSSTSLEEEGAGQGKEKCKEVEQK